MSWAVCARGHRHWGRRGAAGLLLAAEGAVLLQLRASWAHLGGTWSIPGGARERGESALDAALREAREELGIDPGAVSVSASYVASCGGWTYETLLGTADRSLRVVDAAETEAHRWVPAAEVLDLPLHPAFREAWEDPGSQLRAFAAG
jgi:8-oxo-dGTP pyrophosphatase MutT (NUDIX family)